MTGGFPEAVAIGAGSIWVSNEDASVERIDPATNAVVARIAVPRDPDYLAVAMQVNKIDLYKQAATLAKAQVPKDAMRTSKLVDGVVWDGKSPRSYAGSFKIMA